MQVIYDFWNKLWGNEEPKNAKGTVHQPVQGAAKPIPMTQKKSVNIASNPVACPKEPQLDIKTKRKAPENPIFQIQLTAQSYIRQAAYLEKAVLCLPSS